MEKGKSPMPTTRAKRPTAMGPPRLQGLPPGPRVADSDDEPQAPAAKRVCRRGAMITLGTDFGGLETPRLALLNLGYHVRHLFTSEWDKHCVKLSQCLFSDIKKRYGDVAERDNNTAHRVDVYVAGVPCCSWAACGPGTGLADERGQLWAHSLAYVVQAKPKLALFECAPTLITWKKFRPVLDRIVNVLEQAGYQVERRIVNTQDHGLPQHRPRTYVLALLRTNLRKKLHWPEPLGGVVPLAMLLRGMVAKRVVDMVPKDARSKNLVEGELGKVAKSGQMLPQGARIIVELGCTAASPALRLLDCRPRAQGHPR